jgi:hypothetical protein
MRAVVSETVEQGQVVEDRQAAIAALSGPVGQPQAVEFALVPYRQDADSRPAVEQGLRILGRFPLRVGGQAAAGLTFR